MTTKANPSKRAIVKVIAKQANTLGTAGAKRAEDLLTLIARRKSRILEDFYDIGESLHELHHKQLFTALGFDSFDALLAAREVMGRTQAYKLITIVKSLPRARALELGQERAYALAALAAATPGRETASVLLQTGVKVHGKVRDVTKMSKRELEAASKIVRPKRARDPAAAEAERKGLVIARALKKHRVKADVRVVHTDHGFDVIIRAPIDALLAAIF